MESIVDRLQVLEWLGEVPDPEIPVISIQELGILRDVQVGEDGKVTVMITPTYSGCPAMDMIGVQIRAVLQEKGVEQVEVISLLEPTWTTDWITETGKSKLLEYGIVPPVEKTTDASFLSGRQPVVPCPRCGSEHSEMISRFGSTACKSLYVCKDCLEPFDYFKCH